ncbi:hypothetical protein H4Q26_001675 [Puccinia striiformis f. sp. tritici PST-130]|nr:hypothetical protein H4Q26_001675 [Puccinia striiformis f. sp. tritici PST-130]
MISPKDRGESKNSLEIKKPGLILNELVLTNSVQPSPIILTLTFANTNQTTAIKSYELVEKSGEVFKGIYRGKIYAQQKKLEQGSSSICNVDSNPDHPGCLESEEDEDEGGGDGCKTATKNDDGNDPRKSRVKAGMVVALKIIIIQNELDGLPMTVLQEIRILKSLDHSNIVLVIDISYLKGNLKLLKRGNTYMVL